MRPNDLIDALTLAGPALTAGLGVGAAGYWPVVARPERGWRRPFHARGALLRDWSGTMRLLTGRWRLGWLTPMLLLVLLVGPPPASAAPAGHALPFVGSYPIIEGPWSDDAWERRDAESLTFGLPVRTPVLASADGDVVFAGWQPRAGSAAPSPLGVVVRVRHDDGTLSEYGHLSSPVAWVGKRIARGEVIALSGLTGETDRPALFFAILVGTTGAGFDGRAVSLRDLPGLDWERGLAVGEGRTLAVRNLALGRAAWATSEEGPGTPARLAVDGNPATRFSSGHRRRPEELGVELGGRRVVSRVVARREAARPAAWTVLVATPGPERPWRPVWRTDDGGDEARFAAVEALAVVVRGEDHWRRGWANLSLYELEVYGF